MPKGGSYDGKVGLLSGGLAEYLRSSSEKLILCWPVQACGLCLPAIVCLKHVTSPLSGSIVFWSSCCLAALQHLNGPEELMI